MNKNEGLKQEMNPILQKLLSKILVDKNVNLMLLYFI